jgi:hypothetical protein
MDHFWNIIPSLRTADAMQLLLNSLQRSGILARLHLALTKVRDSFPRPDLGDGYQPEKHYMRGPGPKTLQAQSRARRQAARPATQPQVNENGRSSRRA